MTHEVVKVQGKETDLAKLQKTMHSVIEQRVKASLDGAHVLVAYQAELAKLGDRRP